MTPEPDVISEQFYDADNRPVDTDDPAAVRAEVTWLDADGVVQRTYADL